MSNSDELLTKGFQLGVETAWKALEARLPAATKEDLDEMEKRIMSKISDVISDPKTFKTQLDKAKAEILTKIQALIDAAGDRELTPEEEQARTDLKTTVQALDDIGDPNA